MAGSILSWNTTAPAARVDEHVPSSFSEGAEQELSHIDELEALYLIRRPEMIRFLVGFGVDLVEAEDIMQEVFLDAFDGPKNRKRPENPYYWMRRCARNLAISRYRRDKREILAPAERWKSWENTLPDTAASPDGYVYQQECELRLARAISQLTPIEQQCVILRSRGVTFREIAKALDVSMQDAVYTTDKAIKKVRLKVGTTKR